MAKLTTSGTFGFDYYFLLAGLGLESIDPATVKVKAASATRYVLDLGGDRIALTGVDLAYARVEVAGTKKILVPKAGLVTDFSGEAFGATGKATGLKLDAADFLKATLSTEFDDHQKLLEGRILKGDDVFRGGDGIDTLGLGAGKDVAHGGAEGDFLVGGSGNDRLFGDDGDDTLRAGKGSDRIQGGAGNDEVAGGDGDDRLAGGEGIDTFVYADANEGHDLLADFQVGTDRLFFSVPDIASASDLDIGAVDGHAAIFFGTTTIEFLNVAEGGLSAADFFFG